MSADFRPSLHPGWPETVVRAKAAQGTIAHVSVSSLQLTAISDYVEYLEHEVARLRFTVLAAAVGVLTLTVVFAVFVFVTFL